MGKKGGPEVYQSPYIDETDQLGFQTMLGMIGGQGVTPSPALNNSLVAQQLGGKYDPKDGSIVMPDGSKLQYNTLTNSYDQVGQDATGVDYRNYAFDKGGLGFQNDRAFKNYVNSGGQLYDLQGNAVDLNLSQPNNPYASKANEILGSLDSNVYDNANSAWNMFSNIGNEYSYNPSTGQYESSSSGKIPEQMTGQKYLDQYGGYLNTAYSPNRSYQPTEYNAKSYNQFDYNAPTVGSVDNISDAARMNIYQRGADQIATHFRDNTQDTEDFISQSGGSLSSGRAMALKRKNVEDKNRQLDQLQRDVNTEHELRNYEDAKRRRDLQADYDWQATRMQGDENRYGYEAGRDENRYGYEAGRGENRYGYEAGRDENRYGFEDAQKRGRERMGIVEGIDAKNRDRAFADLQANRQQGNNQMSALLDMLRVYGGLDSNAVQLAAAQAQATGGALGSLFGGAASALGGLGG